MMRGLAIVCSFAALAASAAPAMQEIVVCSPGSPGSTEEARPAMEALAAAASAKAGEPVSLVYDPSETGGVARLRDAGIGIVSLPLFLAHEHELGLHARLEVVQKGRPELERWELVAPKGRIKDAKSLAGLSIVSSAAYAPAFVRGVIAGELGALPAGIQLTQSSAVLSALRHAADGDPVAVLLDGPQAAALGSLAFADKLEVVARSPAIPAGVVVTIDKKVPAAAWQKLAAALVGLASDPGAAAALDGIQIARFAPLDDKALAAARELYGKGNK